MKNQSKLKVPYSYLSRYTIAKNCCDLNDVHSAIGEVECFISNNFPADVPLAYRRLNALKKRKYQIMKTEGKSISYWNLLRKRVEKI